MKKSITLAFAGTAALALGTLLNAASPAPDAIVASSSSDLPPCEAKAPDAKPPKEEKNAPAAPKNLRILGGSGLEADDLFGADEILPSGPSVWPEFDGSAMRSSVAGPHDYYFSLASRGDCFKAFSLRNQDQIEQYRRTKNRDSAVTYSPATDTDPRKQDAAKIVIPVETNSLPTQLWLPVDVTTGGSVLITWDAWFGKEFEFANTGITNYKAFQFGSPSDSIWSEVRNNFNDAKGAGVAKIDGRIYFSTAYPQTTHRGPNITGIQPLAPQKGTFTIKAETWTRYWGLYETGADGWDYYSLWVADETVGPVQIFDRLQLKFRDGKLGVFRFEYNTSTSPVKENRGPLVSYARNVVMLRGVAGANVPQLFERPVR